MDRREYEMLFKLNAQLGGNYNSSFNSAQKKVAEMERELQSLNKRQGDIAAYQKQQKAITDTNSKLELLKKQYDNIQKEIGETEGYSADMQNKLLQKQMQIEKTASAVKAYESKLSQMDEALKKAGVDTGNLTEESAKLSGQYADIKTKQETVAQKLNASGTAANVFGENTVNALGAVQSVLAAAGIVKLLQETAEAMQACAEASIDFESGMTGIDKTSNLTKSELASMSDEVKALATEIPVTTDELTQIGETAGQLGIEKQNLIDFTTIMAELGTATTMTADNAATLLAQFANITGMDPKYYSNLGSAIVNLGNSFATTEQKITEMSQGIAASGSIAGMSEADMVGLSAAVSSLGIESEMGATSVNKLISDLMTAVSTGENLNEFARIANMSAEEFKVAWGENAAGALTSFVTGLSDTSRLGTSAIVTLNNLGITETRMQRTILSLSNSGDLLTRAIDSSNTAWNENTALATEAEKRYATTASKLAILQNAYGNLKIAVGDQYNPAVKELSEIGAELLNDMTDFVEEHPVVVAALTTLTVGAAGFGAALTGLSAATTLFKTVFSALSVVLKANPWIWAVSGAVAAVSAIVALTATVNQTESEYEALSLASREQYDELQALETQYNRVSDAFGENSYRAQELKNEVDAATQAFEENKRTAEEVTEAQKAVIQSHNELIASYEETISKIDSEGAGALNLAARLETLVGAEGKTAAVKNEILTLVQMLNEEMPELGLKYDDYADSLNLTADQLEAVIEAEIIREKQAENYSKLKEFYSTAQTAEEELANAKEETKLAEENLREAMATRIPGDEEELAYAAAVMTAKKALEEKQEAESTLQSTYDDSIAQYNELMSELTGYTEDTNSAADATVQLTLATGDVTSKVSELVAEYEEAYGKAYDSISGQMGLFDTMKISVGTSVDEMISALESQVAYMATYSENINKAQSMGLNSELLSQLSDGSAESAAYLQAIVEAGQSKVDELNAAFSEVEQGKTVFSDAVAEMETGFSEKMSQMQSGFAATVGELDLSADAKEGAINTIDAFIAGLDLAIPDALTKVQNFGNDIKSALGASFTITISGTGEEIEHNAQGTTYAADVFVAGEEGPELVVGKGGSTVYTAEETKAMAAAANEYLQVMALSPQFMSYLSGVKTTETALSKPAARTGDVKLEVTYQISGGTTEEVKKQLNQHDEELRQMLVEMLEDIETDRGRVSYE